MIALMLFSSAMTGTRVPLNTVSRLRISGSWFMGNLAICSSSSDNIKLASLFIHFQHSKKSLLRNLYAPDLLHALLALFLFFQQLAFARDVAAIAFGDNVFAKRLDGFARDDLVADCRLDGHFKELARNQLF